MTQDKEPKGYGHWAFLAGGQLAYVTGPMTRLHPHYDLSNAKSSVKKLSRARMHGVDSRHADGVIIIDDNHVPHNNLRELTKQIRKLLQKQLHIRTGKSNHGNEFDISFGNSSIFANTSRGPNETYFVISEGNGHPVMVHKRQKNYPDADRKLLDDVAEYLAHEHHRLAWHIHHDSQNTIASSPDHISPNKSPLECWPVHSVNMMFRQAPLISSGNKEK